MKNNKLIINNIQNSLKKISKNKNLKFLNEIYFNVIDENELFLSYDIVTDKYIQDIISNSTIIWKFLKIKKKKEFFLDKIILDIFNSAFQPTEYLITTQLNVCKNLLNDNRSITLDLACYYIDEDFKNNILINENINKNMFLKIDIIHENKFTNDINKSLSQLIFYVVLLSISSFEYKEECISYDDKTNKFYVYGSTFNINCTKKIDNNENEMEYIFDENQNNVLGFLRLYLFSAIVKEKKQSFRNYYVNMENNKFKSIIVQIETKEKEYEVEVFIDKIGSIFSDKNKFNIMDEVEINYLIHHIEKFIEIVIKKDLY